MEETPPGHTSHNNFWKKEPMAMTMAKFMVANKCTYTAPSAMDYGINFSKSLISGWVTWARAIWQTGRQNRYCGVLPSTWCVSILIIGQRSVILLFAFTPRWVLFCKSSLDISHEQFAFVVVPFVIYIANTLIIIVICRLATATWTATPNGRISPEIPRRVRAFAVGCW